MNTFVVVEGPYRCTAGRGLAHAEQLLEILSAVEVSAQPFETLSSAVLHHAPKLSGAILVFTEWDEQRRQFAKRLRSLSIPLEILVIRQKGQPKIEEEQWQDNFHVLIHGDIAQGLAEL